MAEERRVVDYIVDQLASRGIGFVFGVDGANIEDLYDALNGHPGVTGVLAKHESAAAAMADGYSRAGSGVGVVAATSGGGALNLIAGLGESFTSRIPVLALVGQAPTTLDGLGAFQDTSGRGGSLDAVALFSAVSVYCRRVTDPADIGALLGEALAAAQRGGPAVLLLPKDIQQSQVYVPADAWVTTLSRTPDPTTIADVIRRSPGRVTIVAGDQVARDDARAELAALGEVLGAAVVTAPDAKDVATSAQVTGVMGHPGVAAAIRDAEVCLLVGTRLSVTARVGLEDALAWTLTLSIGAELPYLPAIHVRSDDLRRSLARLTALVQDRPATPPVTLPPSVLRPPEHDGPGIRYADAMAVLDEELPDGTDVVADAGNTGAAAIHLLPARGDGRFVVALGMGGMGFSFGAAIGMSFARRRRTVVIAGDGSFFMHGMELHTAVQYGLPITAVLFNNNAHAMCVTREQVLFGSSPESGRNRFSTSRLGAGLAAMFPDLPSVDVADADSLRTAVREALTTDGPSVISVDCSADEIPPFAPFLTTKEPIHVPARA
jgi:acetolactate synthase I/II/III large subunit